MWIDPNDEHHHRLYALGAFDNTPRAQMFTDSYGLTRLVLRYAFSSIKIALSSFEEDHTQTHLRRAIAASIKEVFQQDELPKTIARKERRPAQAWICSKIFLDHSLLDILIKVTENCFGRHFSITVTSLEGLFNKAETLPVSLFYYLLSANSWPYGLVPHTIFQTHLCHHQRLQWWPQWFRSAASAATHAQESPYRATNCTLPCWYGRMAYQSQWVSSMLAIIWCV